MIRDDGEVARLPDIIQISRRFELKIITIEELIRFRKRKEKLIERFAEVTLPTKWGIFKAVTYRSILNNETHIALVKGDVEFKKRCPGKGAFTVPYRRHIWFTEM